MAATTLISTILMGLLLLVITAVVLRLRNWRREAPTSGDHRRRLATNLTRDPNTWGILFFLVTVVITASALVFVGGLSVPGVEPSAIGTVLIGGFGLLLSVLLFGGVYSAARSRGAARSLAIFVGVGILGILFILGIAAQLLVAA